MSKLIFELGSVILLSLFLFGAGCNANVDVNEIKNEAECRNLGGDYIWIPGRCCLDANHNGNCDEDEGSRSCSDDCSQSGCMEDNQFKPYDCVVGDNGCKQRKVLDIQIERCNVECLNAEGCRLGQKCSNYKCENKVCGDGECDDTENCNCIDCPTPEDSICCEGVLYVGNCCSNEECESGEICLLNNCTTCGNGICNEDESCITCLEDCPISEGEICCGDDSDCEGNMTCTENVCS